MLSYDCHLPFLGRFVVHFRFPIPSPASFLCVPFPARRLAGSYPTSPRLLVSQYPLSSGVLVGDRWLSQVPELSLCTHALLSDPGGFPLTRLFAFGFAAFRMSECVGFPSSFSGYPSVHVYAVFRGSMSRPMSLLYSVSHVHCWFCM
jgi:hypothetical protein